VKAVATEDGLVVESYIYRPDGSFLIFGLDTTAPQLVLARVRPADEAAERDTQTLELVFTEQVQQAGGAIEVRDGGGGTVADAATPTDDARRWTVALDPALVEGDSYTLYLVGFEDLAGNAIAAPVDIEFTAPAEDAELALPGSSEASVLAIIDGPDGLAFVTGVPIDPDSVAASSITVSRSGNEVTGSLALVDATSNQAWDDRVLLWTPDDQGAFLAAEYDLALDLALLDVAGDPIRGPPETIEFFRNGKGDIVWSKPSEVPLLGGSQVGNDRFLHGRPYIASLGLYDHRARFYEPGTQLFLEPDPLGPVDSPNLYQAFGFDGMNVVDPWGMVLKRENVIDPEKLMYRYKDKFYQVSAGGAVYWVDIEQGGKHKSITHQDPDTAKAVMELTEKSACSTCGGLRKLSSEVEERVTEDDVKTAALLYWSAVGAVPASGGNLVLLTLGGLSASKEWALAAGEGKTGWEQAQSVSKGFYLTVGPARLAQAVWNPALIPKWVKSTPLAGSVSTVATASAYPIQNAIAGFVGDMAGQASEEMSLKNLDIEQAVATAYFAFVGSSIFPQGSIASEASAAIAIVLSEVNTRIRDEEYPFSGGYDQMIGTGRAEKE
jgi:RHS repeat-associated protein